MKTKGFFLAILLGIASPSPGLSQDGGLGPRLFPEGLTFAGGTGRYSIQDKGMADRVFSGTLPYAEISWARFRDGRESRLSLGFWAGEEVRNHALPSRITGASFDLEFVNRVWGFSLFGEAGTVYLGPSVGITTYTSGRNRASSGPNLAASVAALFSAGATSGVVVPLIPRLTAIGALRADLISVGFRIVDGVEDDESSAKMLTAPDGTTATARVGLRYELHPGFSVGLGYEAHLMRISSWDYLGVAGNNSFASVTIRMGGGGK